MKSLVFDEGAHRATTEAFADPQPGDLFSEMGHYWVHVLVVGNRHVITAECVNTKTTFIRYNNKADFRKNFAYGGTVEGYSVLLHHRNAKISYYLDYMKQNKIKPTVWVNPVKKETPKRKVHQCPSCSC